MVQCSEVAQVESWETSPTKANDIIDSTTRIPYIRLMEFEWDENKAATNLVKHGIPFEYTTKFRLDESDLPKLSKVQEQRLDSMSDEEIEKAALSDPDNPPVTDEELDEC